MTRSPISTYKKCNFWFFVCRAAFILKLAEKEHKDKNDEIYLLLLNIHNLIVITQYACMKMFHLVKIF